MYRINRQTKRGFTLIETLLVASMFTMVALAVYATFNSGMKIWQRLSERLPIESVSILLEKMSDDLGNCFAFSGIPFMGLSDSITCPALVVTEMEHQPEALTVGRVRYYLNPRSKTVSRQSLDYSQVYEDEFTKNREMAQEVTSLRFEYYYYDPLQKTYKWKELWLEEDEEARLPLAVRVSIQFLENGKIRKETKTISLAAAAQYYYE